LAHNKLVSDFSELLENIERFKKAKSIMSKLHQILLMMVFVVAIAPQVFAQHILACRGTDQVLIGSSSVFQMQEGETYQVTGVSANGNLMFNSPFGGADYHGNRFRVLNGGQYASTEVIMQNVKGTATEHWQENKAGWRTKYSTWTADWTGQFVLAGMHPVGQCYAAVEWYSDGQPVGAAAKILGTLDPGRAVDVSFSIPITEAQHGGTFSVHVWSGGYELKQVQVQKPEW